MPDSHLGPDGFVILDNPEEVRAAAISACNLCDGDGYIGGTPCDHIRHSTPECRQAAKATLAAALAHRISEKASERRAEASAPNDTTQTVLTPPSATEMAKRGNS